MLAPVCRELSGALARNSEGDTARTETARHRFHRAVPAIMRLGLIFVLVAVYCRSAVADEASPGSGTLEAQVQAAQAAADEAKLAGHNGWMLTSTALVLFMTAPGLAMFYGGLVRKKNVVGVMMQCLFLMGLMTVIWALYGYSLAFGGDGKWIGDGQYLFMADVQRTWDTEAGQAVEPMEGSIPRLTHMLFQGMFFIITPALICGAFGVHGVGGTLGAVLTGVFATRACWDIDNGNPLGLVDAGGSVRILIGQIVAVAVTWAFVAVVTFILLKVLDATMGLRVEEHEEVQGLDLSQHGEEGYIFL